MEKQAERAMNALAEETESSPEDWDGGAAFVDGFRAGWVEGHRVTEPNMVLVDRQYLAQLEERSRLWRAAGGR